MPLSDKNIEKLLISHKIKHRLAVGNYYALPSLFTQFIHKITSDHSNLFLQFVHISGQVVRSTLSENNLLRI